MNDKVSVIIPTYGGSDSLICAVDSVLSQDYSDFEIVVVDDNNPGTAERELTELMMRRYEDQARVTYIKHGKNKNGAAARNTGVKHSSGSYLEFLDDDDIFLPGNIASQHDYLVTYPEYGACYCWRRQEGKEICGELTGDLSEALLELNFTPCTPCLMFRRKAYLDIGGFDETFWRHQDFQLLLKYFEKYSIGVNREVLVEVIGNGVDNQPKGDKAIAIKKQFFSTFEKKIKEIDFQNKGFRKRVYARHYSMLFIKLLRYGDLKKAFAVYWKEGKKGGLIFWKEFWNYCNNIILKKIWGNR